MAYSKKLTPEALEQIKPLINRINSLQDGQSFTFQIEGGKERVRNWLYTYLHIHNLKPIFRIKSARTNELTISKTERIQIAIIEEVELSQIEQFVRDNMLELEDSNAASEFIQHQLNSGKLSHEQSLACFDEWERVMGLDQQPKPQQAENLSDFIDNLGEEV